MLWCWRACWPILNLSQAGPRFFGELSPAPAGLLFGRTVCGSALPCCVQPTLRLGVEEAGLPTWKAGKPVWHNMTDLAPSPWRGFSGDLSPSVGCPVLTKRGKALPAEEWL